MFDVSGQLFDVTSRESKTVVPLAHQVSGGSNLVGSDDRQPKAHCFVDHDPPGFLVGREHQGIGNRVKLGNFLSVSEAEKMNGINKSLATTFFDPQDAHRWIAEGYRMMNVGTVLQLGTERTKEIFSDLRAEFS